MVSPIAPVSSKPPWPARKTQPSTSRAGEKGRSATRRDGMVRSADAQAPPVLDSGLGGDGSARGSRGDRRRVRARAGRARRGGPEPAGVRQAARRGEDDGGAGARAACVRMTIDAGLKPRSAEVL